MLPRLGGGTRTRPRRRRVTLLDAGAAHGFACVARSPRVPLPAGGDVRLQATLSRVPSNRPVILSGHTIANVSATPIPIDTSADRLKAICHAGPVRDTNSTI